MIPLHSIIQNILYEKTLEAFEQIQLIRTETPAFQDFTDQQVAHWIGGTGYALEDDFYQWLEETDQREPYED